MNDRRIVSILVPCYEEEASVSMLGDALKQVIASLEGTHDVEILFIDDGSTDGTSVALEELAPQVRGRVLKHPANRGIAEAFRTGFAAAKGDVICTIDADCTFDPRELPSMIAELEASGADIVAASPYHPEGGVNGVSMWRLWLSRGASRLYGYLLPTKLYSYTACFRVCRRDAVLRLEFDDPGFFGVTEMMVSAILQKMNIVERPMVLKRRRTGVSKIRVLRVMGQHLRFMARLYREEWR